MSILVINDLPKNKQLDQQALAEFNGGGSTSSLLAQIKAETARAASELSLDQESELSVSPTLRGFASPTTQPFNP